MPIGEAVSGPRSCRLVGEHAGLAIAVQSDARPLETFDRLGAVGRLRVGQLPVCYDREPDAPIAHVHAQFRWFGGGWKANAELPGSAAFAAASQYVRPQDVAASIPCGNEVEQFVAAAREYVEAGFAELALLQGAGSASVRSCTGP